ncbi:hypothetical protein EJ110_NYTH23275 [Nymphaea thermarum]|nr:hypothetical protein EJ110_NYTH23275 [Nymphaea thermarum]
MYWLDPCRSGGSTDSSVLPFIKIESGQDRPENLKVPPQGSSTEGDSGSKIRPKGVVDGHRVNIHVLPLIGPQGWRRLVTERVGDQAGSLIALFHHSGNNVVRWYTICICLFELVLTTYIFYRTHFIDRIYHYFSYFSGLASYLKFAIVSFSDVSNVQCQI